MQIGYFIMQILINGLAEEVKNKMKRYQISTNKTKISKYEYASSQQIFMFTFGQPESGNRVVLNNFVFSRAIGHLESSRPEHFDTI